MKRTNDNPGKIRKSAVKRKGILGQETEKCQKCIDTYQYWCYDVGNLQRA